MIFMRYIAADVEGLTPGKIYFGAPLMQSGEMVDNDTLTIRDDNDNPLRIDPSNGQFEFFDEVYAVWLRTGSVVVVINIETKDNQCFAEIKDIGYRSCDSVLMLDRTNVYPGVTVLDGATNRWEAITSVNESLWIKVGSEGDYRPPTGFKFAIHEGDILLQPFARCILEDGVNIKNGRLYRLISGGMNPFDPDELVEVIDDFGHKQQYLASRFKIF